MLAGLSSQADPDILPGAVEKVVTLVDQGRASDLGQHVSASIKEVGTFT
ncbi:MAG: hypothetical protein ACRCWR_09860 [Saezia sp.]